MKRLGLFALIFLAQFAALEVGMRWWGGSEAAPAFQQLFMQDPRIGHRLRPGASARYTTTEFSAAITINPQGVRDDRPIGPKPEGEKRIVILGDSLVMSVQVDIEDTFARHLEHGLNAQPNGASWRVINAGVQGYGPVESWLFYKHVVDAFEPDLVLMTVFVGNDAVEAHDRRAWLTTERGAASSTSVATASLVRRVVRSSMVLQNARLRWDFLVATIEGPTAERPLTSYLPDPPAEIVSGLDASRHAFSLISDLAANRGARAAFVLMPARFQTDDADFERLDAIVTAAGGTLVRDAATKRFRDVLSPLGLPMLDLLPVLQEEPNRQELFFQQNVHLTPRGHRVVADALVTFVRAISRRND